MPITFNNNQAIFQGECQVAEADALFEWLQKNPEGEVFLGGCTHFHAALLQVLMAVKARIVEPPANSPLAKWIVGVEQATDSPRGEYSRPLLVVVPNFPPALPVTDHPVNTTSNRDDAP